MGADFIFSFCRIPGSPLGTNRPEREREFKCAVTQMITDMSDNNWKGLLISLENHGLWVEDDVPTRKSIIERVVSAEKDLAGWPRDVGSFTIDDKDYYISGLMSHGDGTESMEDINWLIVTGCEEIGHD